MAGSFSFIFKKTKDKRKSSHVVVREIGVGGELLADVGHWQLGENGRRLLLLLLALVVVEEGAGRVGRTLCVQVDDVHERRHHQRVAEGQREAVAHRQGVQCRRPVPVRVLVPQNVKDFVEVELVEIADQGAQGTIPAILADSLTQILVPEIENQIENQIKSNHWLGQPNKL